MTDRPSGDVADRFVDAGGIRTHVHEGGDGPPVLLVHGSGPGVSASANWRLTVPALADRFRVVAPDVVGFGATERPAGFAYDLPTWTRHLLGVLDALSLDRVSLVGNSFGGALALSLAAAAPERVERLVLMGSAGTVFPLSDALDRVWGFDARSSTAEQMRSLLELFADDRSRITDDLVALRLDEARAPGVAEAYLQMFPPPRDESIARLSLPTEVLARIQQPTLLVHGAHDRVIPLQASLNLLDALPDAELAIVARCGHWVQIEAADRFVTLVCRALSQA